MSRPSTSEKKKIKMLWLEIENTTVGNTSEADEDTLAAPDDLRIVGFHLSIRPTVKDAVSIVPDGMFDCHAVLTRGAVTSMTARLGMVQGRLHAAASDSASSVVVISGSHMTLDKMYPEGYGIDLDEGDPLSLISHGRQNLQAASVGIVTARAQILYVER